MKSIVDTIITEPYDKATISYVAEDSIRDYITVGQLEYKILAAVHTYDKIDPEANDTPTRYYMRLAKIVSDGKCSTETLVAIVVQARMQFVSTY